jgi:hypothetical protein
MDGDGDVLVVFTKDETNVLACVFGMVLGVIVAGLYIMGC